LATATYTNFVFFSPLQLESARQWKPDVRCGNDTITIFKTEQPSEQ